ncbi:MAG: TonB-dependent receptor, partial [Rhodothermales bacterium]
MHVASRLTLFMLSLLVAGAAWTQDRASIGGYVRDATSGETLLLANVRLDGTTVGAATNNSGYYVLAGLTPGSYTVTASYIGYREERVEVELAPGEQRRLDLELYPEGLFIGEVTVTAEEELEYDARKVGVQQLQTELIKTLPTVLQPDVFRSLQLLPGVKAASDYSSGLYIRGGSPDQTLILLDRTTVYNPSHFFGFFSTFNPDAIKDVRLYKGGFPAEYGGRIGSVVDIYNRDGNRREFHAGLSVGLLSSRAIVEGPYRRGSYMLALRRSTLEPLLHVLRRADVEGIPDSFYFLDANGKINFDASSRDMLSLAFYAGGDVLDIEFVEDARAAIRYGNNTVSLTWTHLFSETFFSTFTATGSQYFSTPTIDLSG